MKKLLYCVTVLVLTITLTGCGKKSVTCEGDMTESNITAGVKVVGNFDNDKLVKQTIEMDFDLTNYLQYADVDAYYEGFKNQYDKFNEYEGISTNLSKGEKSIIVKIEMDFTKIDKETYKELNFGTGNAEVSLSKFKDEFVDMGLTCK